MTIRVTFDCGGCDATAEGTRPLRTEFISLSGQDHGLGPWHIEPATAVKPDGWMAVDPFTGCCYCGACWAAIEAIPGEADKRIISATIANIPAREAILREALAPLLKEDD